MTKRFQSFYDNAQKHTFEYDGAKITVREGLGVDRMDKQIFYRLLKSAWADEQNEGKKADDKTRVDGSDINDLEWNRVVHCVGYLIRAVSIEGKLMLRDGGNKLVEFRLPSAPTQEEWSKTYELFLYWTDEFAEAYDAALVTVNRPEVFPDDKQQEKQSTKNS